MEPVRSTMAARRSLSTVSRPRAMMSEACLVASSTMRAWACWALLRASSTMASASRRALASLALYSSSCAAASALSCSAAWMSPAILASRFSMFPRICGQANLASTTQMTTKPMRAGMNSPILGMSRSTPDTVSSARAAVGESAEASTATDAAPASRVAMLLFTFMRASSMVSYSPAKLLDDQGDNEADQGQGLDECGSKNEDREQVALDLGLTGHSGSAAIRSHADSQSSRENADGVSDVCHNSSFDGARPWCGPAPLPWAVSSYVLGAALPRRYLDHAPGAGATRYSSCSASWT